MFYSAARDKEGKETRNMQHICAFCVLKDYKQLPHAEQDPSCPRYDYMTVNWRMFAR